MKNSLFLISNLLLHRKMSRLFTYNPFEPLTPALIDILTARAYHYLVVQQFRYPGIAENKGFMATGYPAAEQAHDHFLQLRPGEGKVLQLHQGGDREKLLSLMVEGSSYRFFYGTTPDADACRKLSQTYKQKVNTYIRSQLHIKNDGGYDVTLKVVAGRFMAIIASGQQRKEVLFYDIIR